MWDVYIVLQIEYGNFQNITAKMGISLNIPYSIYLRMII